MTLLQPEYQTNGTVSYTLQSVPNNRDPMDDNGVDYTNAQAWMSPAAGKKWTANISASSTTPKTKWTN